MHNLSHWDTVTYCSLSHPLSEMISLLYWIVSRKEEKELYVVRSSSQYSTVQYSSSRVPNVLSSRQSSKKAYLVHTCGRKKKTEKSYVLSRRYIIFISFVFFKKRILCILCVGGSWNDCRRRKTKKSQKTTSYLIIQANFKEHTNMLCRPQKNKDKNKNSKHNS